jgi:hypothetical protein
MFDDASGLEAFSSQLLDDICSSLKVPRATVHVLCFKKGSMLSVAEVFLNRILDHSYPGSGYLRTPADVAEELVEQAEDRDSPFRRTVSGHLARSAEVIFRNVSNDVYSETHCSHMLFCSYVSIPLQLYLQFYSTLTCYPARLTRCTVQSQARFAWQSKRACGC